MSLLFQHPALVGLLALAGLPVLVHLLSRARPPVYRFPNIDFLRRVLRLTARLRRPQDWLLLALRTLALFALAAAFIAPVLVSKNAALPGEKSTVILLVDRSASMAAREGAGSRFETACARASRFLESARPAAANLIWIDAEPDAAFPEPGPNLDYLTDQLKQAEPRPEAGALSAAFDLALRQLAQATGHRELVVLSDFQASAWRDFAPNLPPNITVHAERVASSSPPNLAVTNLITQPADPVVGQDLTILARVRNFSPDPVRSQLTLDADGARQSQTIDLTPWGEAESAFTLRPATAAPLPLSILTEPDAFPLDDARHAVVRVRDSLRLAFESPAAAPESRLFHKIADALPWLEIAEPTSATATRTPDMLLVWPWNGDNPSQLRQRALSGCTVIVHPAATCPPAALQDLLGLPVTQTAGAFGLETSPNGWVVVPEESHPAIRLFRNGDFGNPFAGKFRERLRLPESLGSTTGARPIARYADGPPALVEYPTKSASILLWNLPLDPARTDWPVQGVFLPAIAEILLRTRPQGTATTTESLPGSLLAWTSADSARIGAVTLLGPSNEPLPLTESTTADGTRWQANQPAIPGLHRWQISGQAVDFAAVNFPESESDLRPLDASPVFGNLVTGADSLARQATLAQGLPLWPWLVLSALLFLALESLIHAKGTRLQGAGTKI
jgi:hypothetical protein